MEQVSLRRTSTSVSKKGGNGLGKTGDFSSESRLSPDTKVVGAKQNNNLLWIDRLLYAVDAEEIANPPNGRLRCFLAGFVGREFIFGLFLSRT